MLPRLKSLLFLAAIVPLAACATPAVECIVEYDGARTVIAVQKDSHALAGQWTELAAFRVRSLLSVPANQRAWLLVEIYAKAESGDTRIISSHKLFKPFASGRVTVVEPQFGRSLEYECAAKR
jgi:hypothetical protein